MEKNFGIIKELSHFRRIIEQIKGELLYAGLPLSEIFYNIASREKEPYENWLMDLAFQCQGTQEKRFADLWTDIDRKRSPGTEMERENESSDLRTWGTA